MRIRAHGVRRILASAVVLACVATAAAAGQGQPRMTVWDLTSLLLTLERGLFDEEVLDAGWMQRRPGWLVRMDAVSEPAEVARLAVELEGQTSASAFGWSWLVSRYAWRDRAGDVSTIAEAGDLLWDLARRDHGMGVAVSDREMGGVCACRDFRTSGTAA